MGKKLESRVTLHHPEHGARTFPPTEYNVLKAAGDNPQKTVRELAEQLNLSEGTVRNAFTRIFNNLGVTNRATAIIWYKEAHIVNTNAVPEKQPSIVDLIDRRFNTVQSWQQLGTTVITNSVHNS
jgi:DNA-binding CsgD family transcriptional regulator